MAERQTMPTFVPRTVASFERAATAVARRVAAPVRMLATRALSFADRLVGSWAGAGPMVGGFEVGRERPPMLASGRGGGMPMPRPWYEVEADEDVVLRPQPGMSGDAGPTGTVAASAAVTPAALAARVIAAAERGAAIARTNVTAPPEAVARDGARPGAPATAPAGTAPPTGTTATTAAPGATTAVPAAAETTSATTTTAGAGSVAGGAAVANASAASVRDGGGEARVTVAADDVRVAEALGLRAPSVAQTTVAAAPVARATTPLGRALAHAAWVDAQLRTLTTAATAETSRPAAGYVFIAPADEPVRAAGRGETIAAPAATRAANVPAATWVAPARAAAAQAAAPAAVTGPSAAPVAAWSARLPDPRLSEAMPTAIAQRVAAFVAQLVGAETARDVAPLSATAIPASLSAAMPTPAEAPVAASARVAPQPTYVALPSVSWRPGAAAARIEQLGAQVDARVTAAWGEPSRVAQPGVARTMVAQPGAARTMVAQPGVELDATPASALGGAAARMPERVALAAAAASAPSLARPAIQTIYVAPELRATGPARMAAFVQQLVGVQAARATAPLPVQAIAAPMAMARASAAPGGTVVAAGAPGAPSTASLRVPERIALAATMSPPVAETMGVGSMARRAEQLGGLVGVRAASLSIDFVDPSRFALLAQGAPSLPVVAPEAAPPAGDTIMPAPRPLFAAPARAGAPLSAEEWSLVATFPSAATAVQLAAARVSQAWRQAPATTFVAGGGEREPSLRPIAARGGAPGEYVAPSLMASVVPAESQRLPSGRMPRGSFTWPKLAEPAATRAEWSSSPAAAVAEQSAQAAQASPGMPLWGALPRLETVSPSLAASTGMISPESTARAALAPAGTANATAAAGAADVARAANAARGVDGGAPASSATGGDAPAMTLMTAAATREARATARLGGREAGAADASPTLTAAGADAPRGAGVSNVRPPAMPLMSAGPTSARDGGTASGGPSARALELARPFLKLVEGGLTGSEGTARSSAAGSRFFEQPQPLVAGAPSSDSSARIVEALRSQPATVSGDDRVSLADLTLIAIASATQQVAASPAGGGPGGGGAAAAPSSSSSEASSAHGGAKSAANPAQEIEELARAAFDELQRLLAMARERSGDHG